MIPEGVKALAKKHGGIGAEPYLKEWNDFSVYRVIPCSGYEKMRLGSPILILSSEKAERIATTQEARAIMDEKFSTIKYEDD